jgi:hypothetical protein
MHGQPAAHGTCDLLDPVKLASACNDCSGVYVAARHASMASRATTCGAQRPMAVHSFCPGCLPRLTACVTRCLPCGRVALAPRRMTKRYASGERGAADGQITGPQVSSWLQAPALRTAVSLRAMCRCPLLCVRDHCSKLLCYVRRVAWLSSWLQASQTACCIA